MFRNPIKLAKPAFVGAVSVVVALLAGWLLLATLGWVGREVILHFGGDLARWTVNTELFGTGLVSVGAGLLMNFVLFVALVLLMAGMALASLSFIGNFVLDMLKRRR